MARSSLFIFVAAILLGCSGARQLNAGEPNGAQVHSDAGVAAAIHGSHRSPGAADRDQYRHPVETLTFFGFTPKMTVLDIGPGAGYYTELLAPLLAKDGLYLATNMEPPRAAVEPSPHHWSAYEGVGFDALIRSAPERYGKIQVVRVDYQAPKLNLDGKVDLVLLMREVHMMDNWGTLDTWLREIHRALKPGGLLGLEDHRAAPGSNPDETVKKGYLPEAWVIEKIEAAGFALVGKSEINANPKDTKDYPNGVWSLPPSFQSGPDYTPADARDRAKYTSIGESDRMTLKFVRRQTEPLAELAASGQVQPIAGEVQISQQRTFNAGPDAADQWEGTKVHRTFAVVLQPPVRLIAAPHAVLVPHPHESQF